MKDNELLLVEKVLKANLHEHTERLKIVFDMMINKEKEDFYFDKNDYLNFIKGKIIEADDHIKAFKNLSKICNFDPVKGLDSSLFEEISILQEQINISVKRVEKEKKAIEKRSLFKIVNKNMK
tara:strand:+ start:48 stop:416 length:369 start_codon:yes stop_codon:yes gene_type:complete